MAVGVSFGVIKVKVDGQEYDFSLPRRDSKTGQGHRGFMVTPDHALTVAEAAARRDYTINAISRDSSGMLHDPYNGQRDL
jgi:tRNA nucleotidyltransferase (CCA-adding enzyme)